MTINPVQVEQSERHTSLEPTLFCHCVFTWFRHSELWDVSIFWGYQILHYPPETENFNILMPASLRYLWLSLNLMSSCLSYQQISITGRCRKNCIVRCILLHGYGLRKRRTEGKPCAYVTQYVLACNNAQKLIPCHIGVYCILHVLWPLAVDGKSVLSQTCHSFRIGLTVNPTFAEGARVLG